LNNLAAVFIEGDKSIDQLFYSNTVSNNGIGIKMIKNNEMNSLVEIDVSSIFARAIRNIHENQSVSELFV
jgi:phosphoribosylpyrophosphate synthetase